MLSRWREGRVVCLLNRQRVGCRIAVQWVAWQQGNHKGRPYILMSAQIHPTALPSLHPSAVGSGSECVAVGTNRGRDRKSTRLNSSHQIISYAVFCLKKKKKKKHRGTPGSNKPRGRARRADVIVE